MSYCYEVKITFEDQSGPQNTEIRCEYPDIMALNKNVAIAKAILKWRYDHPNNINITQVTVETTEL